MLILNLDNEEIGLIRSAGDGMEFENTTESSSRLGRWQPSSVRPKPLATSTPSNKERKEKQIATSKTTRDMVGKIKKTGSKSQIVKKAISDIPDQELLKEVEQLRLKLEALEKSKQKLVEEKMKVSNQLGVQTQVIFKISLILRLKGRFWKYYFWITLEFIIYNLNFNTSLQI